MDDMNELGSHELKYLDAMNKSWLQIIWMSPGHELKALDAMSS